MDDSDQRQGHPVPDPLLRVTTGAIALTQLSSAPAGREFLPLYG